MARPEPSVRPPASTRVTEQRAARAILNNSEFRYLEPFLGRTTTVTSAAKELEESVNAVYLRVRHLLRLGLLREVGTIPRPKGGRRVKLYRSSAEAFFVPYALDVEATLIGPRLFEERLQRHFLERMVFRGKHGAGILALRDEEGMTLRLRMNSQDAFFTGYHDGLPLTWHQHELRLSPADLESFVQELQALWLTYQVKHAPDGTPVLAKVAIVPVVPGFEDSHE